jgi:hypothetical protein
MAGGELAPQPLVAGGVGPELEHQREPVALALQQRHAAAGQQLGVGRQRLVEAGHLGHPGDDLVDVLIQDGQEQVGLAAEARVDGADGEPGLLGHQLQRGRVEPAAQEQLPGRRHQLGPGPGAALGPREPLPCHSGTMIIAILSKSRGVPPGRRPEPRPIRPVRGLQGEAGQLLEPDRAR